MSHRTRLVLDHALDTLAYRCWPDGCPRGRTCCVGLVVEVSRREVRAIDSLMDELCRLLPHLRTRDGYASVFVEDPPDTSSRRPTTGRARSSCAPAGTRCARSIISRCARAGR